MAPEQILGRRRDQGPWTDLYAVGCLAWRLFTGEPPYEEGSNEAIFGAHLNEPLPEFDPRLGVPEGLEEWLGGMLAKDPLRRFQRAADAAHALREIAKHADAFGSGDWGDPAALDPLKTTTVDVALEEGSVGEPSGLGIAESDFELDRLHQGSGEGSGAIGRWKTPPIPEQWGRDISELEERRLRGTGLGLFGLRRIPVVDRREERQQLWDALRDAAGRDRPRAVVLHGETGLGKSRLAEWLVRRSHELGAAAVFHATHEGTGSRRDGLAPMLGRHFRCIGLDEESIVGRLERLYEIIGLEGSRARHDMRGLARMMSRGEQVTGLAGFQTPADRHGAFARLFHHLGKYRPVLLWLEDADRGPETLKFIRYLLQEARPDLPVAIVLTASSGVFNTNGIAAAAIEAIGDHERGDWLEVGPLGREHQERLVGDILGLEPEIAADVARRTEGNPMFAIQLVGDWVERGILSLSEQGFTLEAEAEAEIPDDIHELWTLRVEQALDQLDDRRRQPARRALEWAAAFGTGVAEREWRAIAEEVGLEQPSSLVDTLAGRGLAQLRDDGWRFVHGLLCESLERGAREAGRWRDHHAGCVRILEELADDSTPGVARRLAEHVLASGDRRAGLDYLLRAARRSLQAAEYEQTRELLDRHRRLLEEFDGAEAQRADVQNQIIRAELLGNAGETVRGLERAEQAVERAEREGWTDVLGEALRLRASLGRETGGLDEAFEDARRALAVFGEAADEEGTARTHYILGRIEQVRGHTDRAEEHYVEALTWFDGRGNRSMKALVTCDIGYIFITREDWRRARRALKVALTISRELGNSKIAAKCWNRLGEVARFERDWTRARECYRQAEQLFQAPRNQHVTNLNLAFVELADGHYSEAESVLVLLERSFASTGIHYPQVMLGLACCSAAFEEWEAWDERFGAAVASLRDSKMAHPDLPWLAEKNARLTLEAGDHQRTRRACAMAAHQWGMLGDLEKEDAMKEKLDELPAD
jgi:tetratricopeptide (TPR) repeat protein